MIVETFITGMMMTMSGSLLVGLLYKMFKTEKQIPSIGHLYWPLERKAATMAFVLKGGLIVRNENIDPDTGEEWIVNLNTSHLLPTRMATPIDYDDVTFIKTKVG